MTPSEPKIPRLSLSLPFYNEERGAMEVVSALEEALEADKIDYELILVDNGSRDRTSEILDRFAQKNPHIRIVTVPVNQGYGWGILKGLDQARGEYIGFMCGDGQISPQDLIRVFDTIKEGTCDVAKVWRQSRHDGAQRKVVSTVYNLLFSFLFGIRTPDINGTPKIFHRRYFDNFKLSSKDWFIDAELMLKARRLDLKIVNVPVEFFKRKSGKSNVRFKTIWEFVVNICRYRFGGVW